jgi:hypothetical protein
MSLKAWAAKHYARRVVQSDARWMAQPHQTQEAVFKKLIRQAKNTAFGKDHDFASIKSPQDFRERVPVRDYEQLRNYVERIVAGEEDVLWPGRPKYFAKTSGTTSGSKFIPITSISMKEQVRASRRALLHYIHESGNTEFVNGKMIFLQGSPVLEKKGGIYYGRLSGISAHYLPAYLQTNRLPSWETNCIEDWETKVDAVVEETIQADMRVIAGIPSWVQMYFERLQSAGSKRVGDLFPNFSLFVYGGVNYEPYRAKFESLIGRSVDSVELFPASEGFFAFQNQQDDPGLLLLLDAGIYYEFIPADQFFDDNPPRLGLEEVVLGKDYALILSTNAGLWGYNIGDTVRFVSKDPYKVVVSGRIKHFISAFGEHVIAKEVEQAIQEGIQAFPARVNEFTVSPQTAPEEGELPYHEWLIEFDQEPEDLKGFAAEMDKSMQEQNSYYKDLIEGKILQPLKITTIQAGGFDAFMKSIGKLGGQNKVKRLANDRSTADPLSAFKTP